MNFIKRAWLNTFAKWGRTTLLILVTAAILMFVLAGLLISNAANKATEQAKQNVGSTLTLSANREAAFKKMQSSSSSSSNGRPGKISMTPVKLSDAKEIAKNSNISNYNVMVNSSADAKSFDTVSTSGAGSGMMGKMGGGSSTGDITINGVTDTSMVDSFKSKSSKITSGRGLTADDEDTNNTVIESELAEQDNLKVGDTITLKNISNSKKTYKLKIVGIYKASANASTGMMGNDPANTIYTSYTLANTVKGSKYKDTADSVTFNISNPTQTSSVKKAGDKVIDTDTYSLTSDDASYQTVKKSMGAVSGFANKIVWLVAVAGTIILALIVILMVRERRYEIGVLLSLGEARWKIIGQFFTEMVMVLIVSLVIAGAGGQVVGNKLGQQLVSSAQTTQTSSTGSQTTGQPGGGGVPSGGRPSGAPTGGHMGGTANSQKAKQTKLQTQLNATELGQLGGFGLVIMFLAVMIGSFGVLRPEPKKVLIDD
ncbi:ABC transporter permease [Lentilactobacillus senioris DSM 24302 = JCM 17472]|uniref:ABC transporter permease n=1 Tax=Lentilactobacillus senioris DSM 24302 = JCM 17472 TaxID=1423802 RepID=A0A0R2CRD6_9LACO|nr:ABC transporter permease [Lentilactobacillus senioris]KRM94381.1 ABC transporter permease [Lentilactobacillus senioris DSM 24302 = JCM 17472]